MDPVAILKASVKGLPVNKYALGAAGIIAVAAIAYEFKVPWPWTVLCTVAVVLLMVILAIFDKQIATEKTQFGLEAHVLAWSAIGLVVVIAILSAIALSFWVYNWIQGLPAHTKTLQPDTNIPVIHGSNQPGDTLTSSETPLPKPSPQRTKTTPQELPCARATGKDTRTTFLAEISGCVLDEHGQPMAGLRVRCGFPLDQDVTTNRSGQFTCPLSPRKKLPIEIDVPGYQYVGREITRGTTTTIHMVPLVSAKQ